jgi:multidrug transporter EmrE-like cation transporter
MQSSATNRTLRLAGLTLVNTFVQIATMSLIKYSTAVEETQYIVLFGFYVAILAFNVGRFVVWGRIHREFPLGIAYASSAIIFPCIVLLSIVYGEPFMWHQLVGVALVMTGVVALMRDV